MGPYSAVVMETSHADESACHCPRESATYFSLSVLFQLSCLLSYFTLRASYLYTVNIIMSPLKVCLSKYLLGEASQLFNTLQPHEDPASNIARVVDHRDWNNETLT